MAEPWNSEKCFSGPCDYLPEITENPTINPEPVGQSGLRIVLGTGSGLDSIASRLDRPGVGWKEWSGVEESPREVEAASLETKEALDLLDIVHQVPPGGDSQTTATKES